MGMLRGIAAGMQYLSDINYVHRVSITNDANETRPSLPSPSSAARTGCWVRARQLRVASSRRRASPGCLAPAPNN